MLVLDSGGLSRLASRTRRTAALIEAFRTHGLWPPVVPTVVIAESTTGKARTDTNINQLLKTCDIDPVVPERTARRAGQLRVAARQGSAVDALVVALAEPGSTVLTTDPDDLQALAAHADNVTIETV
jgi:predicted nucleic acid-binding protein